MRIAFIITLLLSAYFILASYNPELLNGPDIIGQDPGGNQRTIGNVFSFTSLISGLIVFVFYWLKFSRWPENESAPLGLCPKPTSHFTTWLRYSAWSFCYAGFMVLCFYFIIFFPQTLVFGAKIISDSGFYVSILGINDPSGLQQFFNGLTVSISQNPDAIVIYALIGVTLVWAGAFGDFERRFRLTLQKSALIPTEAEVLIEYFIENPESFKPKDKHVDRFLNKLPDKLIIKDFFSLQDSSFHSKFTQLEFLIAQIKRLRQRQYLKKTFQMYNNDYEKLIDELDSIRNKSRDYSGQLSGFLKNILESSFGKPTNTAIEINTENDSSILQGLDSLADLEKLYFRYKGKRPYADRYFSQLRQQIENDIDNCLRNTLLLIVCGIFATRKSTSQRKNSFKAVGLIMRETPHLKINRAIITHASVVIVLATFFCSLTFFLLSNIFDFKEIAESLNSVRNQIPLPKNIDEVLLWSFYALLMHLFGIISGFLVHRSRIHNLTDEDKANEESTILPDIMESALFGFFINILLFVLLTLPMGRWPEFQYGWFWAIVPGVTAGFTVYYLNKGSSKLKWPMLIAQGLTTALFSLLVLIWRYDIYPLEDLNNKIALFAYTIFCLITSIVIGSLLSWILQSWVCKYRPIITEGAAAS